MKRKTAKKRRKKTERAKKKEKCDQMFSRFIRLKYADDNGYSTCYTCGKDKHITRLQCGHYVERHYLSALYSEENCRPQCVHCNIFKRGKNKEFTIGLVDEIGREKTEDLLKLKYETRTISLQEFDEMIEHYKNKYEKLQKELGLDIW